MSFQTKNVLKSIEKEKIELNESLTREHFDFIFFEVLTVQLLEKNIQHS